MKLLRCCVFILLTTLVTPLFAQDLNPAHRAAIIHLLKAFRFEELMMLGVEKTSKDEDGASNPKVKEYFGDLMSVAQPNEVMERFIPIYAKYLSRDDAEHIAFFLESSAGQDYLDSLFRSFKSGKSIAFEAKFISKENKSAIEKFFMSKAGRVLDQSTNAINSDAAAAARALGEELMLRRFAQAFERILKAEGAAGSYNLPDLSNGADKGVGLFDQFAYILFNSAKQTQKVKNLYLADMRAIGLKELLNPKVFLTQKSITESKQKIQKASDITEQYLISFDKVRQDVLQKINTLDMPSKLKVVLIKNFEVQAEQQYSQEIRFGEIERSFFELARRVLDFAESRLEKITVNGEELLFADESDLDIYRTLIAQIQAKAEEEKSFIKEQVDQQKRNAQWITNSGYGYTQKLQGDKDINLATASNDNSYAENQIIEYKAKINAKIRGHINNQACAAIKSPKIAYDVILLPSGQLQSDPKLILSSGNVECDQAIERAIRLAEPLPLSADVKLFAFFREQRLTFYPNENIQTNLNTESEAYWTLAPKKTGQNKLKKN